jgi:DNA helicase-2/ATP-dependent DNA helicase PcrA
MPQTELNFVTATSPEELNPEQEAAVKHGCRPLLIVAGAGTGKTKVITHRIAHLVASKQAKPEEILALTFTEKAAAEMEERVDVLVPYGFARVWILTFHAFGDRILREYALDLGLPTDFRVLSYPEQIIFFKERLFELPLDYFRPLGVPDKFIHAIVRLFSRAKDEDVTPQEYLAYAEKLQKQSQADPLNSELAEQAAQQMELAQTYMKYQKLLAANGKMDFGDQITTVLKLFREHPLALKQIQERYKYILVDEFQDTNYAQFQLLRILAQPHENITVVADDDQSIYKFRGAAISNILNFTKVYPDAKQVVLTKNYRSTQIILDAAYKLIGQNNPERLEVRNHINKKLRAQTAGDKNVEHLHYDTLSSEAEAVAKLIREKVDAGEYRYQDFAILVRANHDAEPFMRVLHYYKIPFYFTGNRGLYQREEIRLLISFLRAITDFRDYISLYYLAVSDVYLFPVKDITLCLNVAHRQNRTLHYILQHVSQYQELQELSPESLATLKKLLEDLDKFLKLSRDEPTYVVLYRFLKDSGYLEQLTARESIESDLKIQNIAKFFNMVRSHAEIANRDRVHEFVKHLDALIEAGDDPTTAELEGAEDAVHVLTYHKAKGLEFPVVFMVSLVDQKFPTLRRGEPLDLPDELIKDVLPTGDFHLQEERRLFYVGMTRAKRELYLTSARDYGGVRPRKVSQFVLEALDKPRADNDYFKTSPLEAIERFAPATKDELPELGRIPDTEVLSLSHYQIDDYRTCPLKYKYVHILKVPILPHHTVIYGRAIHEAVKEYHRRKMSGRAITKEEIIKIFEKNWISEGFLTREHEEERLRVGREALARFYDEQEASPYEPTYIEKEFSFMLGNNRVTGRWDRVDIRDGEVYIVDFKSSDVRKQEAADKRASESLQLFIYAHAYEKIEGKRPKFVELHFLETGLVGRAEVTEKRIAKYIEEIHEAAKGIRSRDYTPQPELFTCQYCAFSEVCPATAVK